jgi:hypothetical protein
MTTSTVKITIETRTKTTIKRLTVSHAPPSAYDKGAQYYSDYDAVLQAAKRLDGAMDLVAVAHPLAKGRIPDAFQTDIDEGYWSTSDAKEYSTKTVTIEVGSHEATLYYASAQDQARREARNRHLEEGTHYRADQGEVLWQHPRDANDNRDADPDLMIAR